ncbi:MAG TPA: glycoside hydrolase family 13 protein [Jiangellaceae bacterium]|nr:glycoside hydrolase family 13 protein [Jiangellaceae bacterium]
MRDFSHDWWRHAVIYQVYIRSFADGNGDGEGDIVGLRSRLGYLHELGVDALWINPWYPSPMLDGGYDVADYRAINPRFGDLDQAQALIDEAHALGLRVILDMVPNHTSWDHRWFRAALAGDQQARARYLMRPGTGDHGDQPPNDWRSVFGGSAWTRLTEPDGSPGPFYLHLFDASQPDLDWTNPEVHEEFISVLRYWFDRGVDGFRIDVAHGMAKDAALPNLGYQPGMLEAPEVEDHPFWDRDDVHQIYRDWRRVADSYDPPRMFVAEAWVDTAERMANYVRPDELHTTFNFDFVRAHWNAPSLRGAIDRSLGALSAVDAPTTWVLSNHDVERQATRLGRADTSGGSGADAPVKPGSVDAELGLQRARAAALLMLALPGSAYLYQGEELGLPEVLDLPEEALQDPTWERSGHTIRGRDGCRVPLPWTVAGRSAGFGADGSWLPQPAGWGKLSVEAQEDDPSSTLNLYRAALRLRRNLDGVGTAELTWLDAGADVLAFRSGDLICALNLTDAPVPLPEHSEVLLTSGDLGPDGSLPVDTAVWLAVGC